MFNRSANIVAGVFLTFVFFIALFSVWNDSLTMDEVAHLPAGYSYLTQKDMRLNPEHPPLIKDLAAIPLLFIKNIRFPSEIDAWQKDINGQWAFGFHFLYQMGNPADKMIFWGRIPMILLLILLGFYIFKWTRELYGNKAAILALFLFSFSPTFITHGRLITTDVGAATGAFISLYYFVKFLKDSSKKNLIFSAIALVFAQLIKFSLFLLFPVFFILIFFFVATRATNFKSFLKLFSNYFLKFILIGILVLLLIWPLYQYHVLNYPPERQARDSEFLLSTHPFQFLRKVIPQMAQIPILRAWAQYFLGLSMVFQRAVGGHTTYFLGEVSASGWYHYFPVVYLIKEPLALHILTAICLIYVAFLIKKPFWKKPFSRFLEWLKKHFVEFAMLVFVLFYWGFSIASPLNIGVRHLLPVFPFTFLLVGGVIDLWLKSPPFGIKYLVLLVLILWQIVSVISIYPHFLAYFNELVGGPNQGYIYTVNSNLDWGQDLKRLKKWADLQGIEKIYVNYFGGSDSEYYLKEKFEPWWETRDPNDLPRGSYLVVSATFLQGGRGFPVPGFNQPYHYYLWLYQHEPPIAKIGYSIFVYYIQ